jgi:hypothetical protein
MTLGRKGLEGRRITDHELGALDDLQLLALAYLELVACDELQGEIHSENADDILAELKQRGFPQTNPPLYERIQKHLLTRKEP